MRWGPALAFGLAFAAGGCASPPPPPPPGWMAQIDDQASLAALSLPGTHDSGALHEPIAGTAKTQDMAIDEQVAAGVRYLDLRCRDVNDAFEIFHGPYDEGQSFDDVLAKLYAYLDQHPTEAIIASVKEESTAENATRPFDATFLGYVQQHPERWYLGDTVPALGAVRGKLVLLRRFAATSPPLGIDASMWADNTTFTLTTAGATLRIEDDYKVSAIATKWQQITALLGEASGATGASDATLYLTYTSGYTSNSIGVPNVPNVATMIDPMLDAYLADPANAHAHLGVIANDFMTEGRATAIYDTNLP